MLTRLMYISTVRHGYDAKILDEILDISRVRNQQNGLTGLLIFDGRRFLQYLEGEKEAVYATFERIKKDTRHYAVVKLRETEGSNRQFTTWDMALCESSSGAEFDAHVKTVAALTMGCDMITTAELRGFVEQRAA
jgi:hypothetical protein